MQAPDLLKIQSYLTAVVSILKSTMYYRRVSSGTDYYSSQLTSQLTWHQTTVP